jgi:AI-2 transport protein TqsA
MIKLTEKIFTRQNDSQRGMRFLISGAALVVIIYGIYQAQSIISLILVAGFLAVIGTPMIHWLVKKRVPSAAAVLMVIAGFIGILTLIGLSVGISVKSIISAAPFYQTRLQQQFVSLKELLAGMGITVNDSDILGYVNYDTLKSLGTSLAAGMGSLLSNMILILLTVAFILLEASTFPIKLRKTLGDPKAVFPEFSKFVNDIRRYVVIQTAVSLTAGILAGAWLAILGIDFAILFGLLTFLLNYIPNVGSVVAIVPAAIIAFIQFGIGRCALAVGGYALIIFIIGNIVQPKLMGQKLGLSTLVVFLSLLFWGSLLGVIGMILCVPFTMLLKFVLERSENTRWIAALLGRLPPGEPIPPVSIDKDENAQENII